MNRYPSNYILQAAMNAGHTLILLVSSTNTSTLRLKLKEAE